MKSERSRYKGTTLLEILLVITLILFLSGLSATVFLRFQFANELESAMSITVNAFHTAKTYAASGRLDDDWGVKVERDKVTVFKGNSYDIRNSDYDQVFSFARGVDVGGTTEFVFHKQTGYVSDTGFVAFGSGSLKHEIWLNRLGVYYYGISKDDYSVPSRPFGDNPGSLDGIDEFNGTPEAGEVKFKTVGEYTLTALTQTKVDVLVVAGGGGGGGHASIYHGWGGGGSGGLITQEDYLVNGDATVRVGDGGKGYIYDTDAQATSGEDSSFGSLVAFGGGGGSPASVRDGGSGGGGGSTTTGEGSALDGGSQGNDGADGNSPSSTHNNAGGGGGGYSEPGSPAAAEDAIAGDGGDGIEVWGNWYAGGGGGSTRASTGTAGSGGAGGGGNGGAGGPGTDATPNTGGGGGAGKEADSGAGGSGIVIVRWGGYNGN